MISRRGMEMAVSTLVMLVIAVLLLLGLVFMLTGGFTRFKNSTEPFVESVESSAVREACRLSCTTQDYRGFCCAEHDLSEESIRCTDARLDVSCSAARCDAVSC